MAQIWGLLALRLAGDKTQPTATLPLNATLQAEAILGYIKDAQKQIRSVGGPSLDFLAIETAQNKFAEAANKAMADRADKDVSEKLAFLERHFLTKEGLP